MSLHKFYTKCCIALAWHDGKRSRIAVGYVGEGIDADTWYRVDNGTLVQA